MVRLKDIATLVRHFATTQTKEAAVISLFDNGQSLYGTRPSSFAASALVQIAVLGLMIGLTALLATRPKLIKQELTMLYTPSDYILKPSKKISGGGGGGGDHNKIFASKGALPKQSRSQFAPPVVIRPQDSKLPVDPTVVAPQIALNPNIPTLGDPKMKMPTLSNGTGEGGGIGSGSGGGVGVGHGPGVGEGEGGGVGGGVYRIGGGVSAPRPEYTPEPNYSDEARKAKYQGTVVLQIIVGPDGRVHNATVYRALGMGLDEKAIEAVHKWKFQPAEKDGHPVSVVMNVEVDFRLF